MSLYDHLPEDDNYEIKIEDLFREKLDSPKFTPFESTADSNPDKIIKTANNQFLLNVLSPQISLNEAKKRQHKDMLLIAVAIFLSVQFLILSFVIGYCLFSILECHKSGNPFSDSTLRIIFTFICTYITSVVVELIAILKYIVKNVFDTSISGLVSDFKDGDSK